MRALRIALAAGAVAGLVVIAACTDTGGKSITAPTSIRKASIGTGGFNLAKKLTLCLDASAPTGVYTFVNTVYNRSLLQGGVYPGDGYPLALLGNGNHPGGPPSYDSGDGGDGTTASNTPNAGTSYTLTITQPTAPTVGNGGCVVVLNRTSGDADFMAALPQDQGGNCIPGTPSSYPPGATGCGGVNDQFAAADIQYLSSTAAVVYDHTDCTLDNGVTNPERVSPPAGFTPSGASGLSFQDGTQDDGHGGTIPAAPPNYPCGAGFNPIRAFANFEHGSTVTFAFIAAQISDCVLGYPYGTGVTATAFNESGALSSYGRVDDEIRVWYTDEHSLTLGVDSFFVKNKTPPNDHGLYAIEHMPVSNPSHAGKAIGAPISVGSTITTGLRAALDGSGRPLHPALFLTDITGISDNGSHTLQAYRAGDWQYGGGAAGIGGIAPDGIYGSWKGAIMAIDSSKTPPTKTITPRADAFKNHKVVYAGALDSTAANAGNGNNPPASADDLGYSAELVWHLSTLMAPDPANSNALTPLSTLIGQGRSFRLQFMVHDGDQNKGGGDVGEACLNVGPGTTNPIVLDNTAPQT